MPAQPKVLAQAEKRSVWQRASLDEKERQPDVCVCVCERGRKHSILACLLPLPLQANSRNIALSNSPW